MPPVHNVPAEKADLRARFRAARLALSDAERAASSAAITDRVLTLSEVESARTVSVYWPASSRGEVDTRGLIAELVARGVEVALPVVASVPGDGPRIIHRRYESEAALVANRWGLLEPDDTAPAVAPAALDLIVVPALGAGRNGHRVGYGAGYYDAFLPTTRGFPIAVVYAACLVDAVPPEPHDVPVSCVVTEREVIRVG